ncbi:Mss4-like protein [Podospora didyma]|uniref:Mss4-like protein n=1 Tax=Podospora didyma TaxID=330526 RepID=A0AAE0NYI3_9PEZI|nr:Mss4-like protein [Podospora didyma]
MASDLPHQLAGTNRTLTAQCHCKSVHFTITVPTSSLPLPVHLCHCHICRQTHGTLASFHAPLPKDIGPDFIAPSSLSSSLTSYIHGPQAAGERFFCTTCGCHIGDRDVTPDPETGNREWRVASSIFAQHGEDLFQIRSHVFTSGHGTGEGMWDWLPKLGDRPLKIWNPEPGNKTFPIPPPDPPKQEFDAHTGKEVLRAECHCGGFSITFPRPNDVPGLAEDEWASTYVSKTDPNKWVAVPDACNDCRVMNGAHVIAWMFVPLTSISPPLPKDFKFGTLTPYVSSPGVRRAFCGVCGATVFYSSEHKARTAENDGRKIVDIAVGLLRAPEGILAEKWLTWRSSKVGFLDCGMEYDPLFAVSLDKGTQEWATKKFGQPVEFDIPGGPPGFEGLP